MQTEPTLEPTLDQLNLMAAIDVPLNPFHRQAEWKQPCKRIAEETKKRRKMAKQSRKINRRK